MKKRHSVEKIVAKLRQADAALRGHMPPPPGAGTADVTRVPCERCFVGGHTHRWHAARLREPATLPLLALGTLLARRRR